MKPKLQGSLLFLAAFSICNSAFAASFLVNTMADTHDKIPGDGMCDDGTRDPKQPKKIPCSLRAAIEESNGLRESPGDKTIVLPPGTYSLSLKNTQDEVIPLAITTRPSPEPEGRGNTLFLQGARSDLTTITANLQSRVLTIKNPPDQSKGDPIVRISGITISYGKTIEGGSGILIESGC